jgi:8-oxo-dGTP pyrophosphatase MutT (NUDIX family)
MIDPGTADPREFAAWLRKRTALMMETEPVVIGSPPAPGHFRPSSILLPLWPDSSGRVQTLLTLRRSNLGSHAGQISFPGGRRDPEDETLAHTALRETWEEVGVPPQAIELGPRLDDHWSIHSYIVTPFVGWLSEEPVFVPQPSEIERLIVADVQTLMAGDIYRGVPTERWGVRWTAHEFLWNGDRIWGMTAGVLYQFFAQLRGQEVPAAELGVNSLARFLNQNHGER